MSQPLQFKELTPHIDVSFWYELERRKLHIWRLDEPTVVLRAWVASVGRAKHQLPGLVTIAADSFETDKVLPPNTQPVSVLLTNFNTVEQITGLDKKKALADAGNAIYEALRRGDVSSALSGVLFTFADLKTHAFTYILAFPALSLAVQGTAAAAAAVEARPLALAGDCPLARAAFARFTAPRGAAAAAGDADASVVVVAPALAAPVPLSAAALAEPGAVVAYADTGDSLAHPGWSLRNVIAAVRAAAPASLGATFVGLRDTAETSVVVTCRWPSLLIAEEAAAAGGVAVSTFGWVETRLRRVEMSGMMDPAKLAESSARLNLSLMKWRMMPGIELDGLTGCKALLLGSGTLGCHIARNLLMWGVTNITMVDRGTVSYSNPVRQSLFQLSDVLAEGEARVKSVAACAMLKRILPTCNAKGVNLTIRMPGHRVDASQEAAAKADIARLEALIQEHDVTFLLTDSREARWLPTLLAAVHDKPLVNVALGFDTWVVMRHGLPSQPAGGRLGCYFCSDVVAPIDSMTARTLDQQCTVTRPGVSAVSSAVAVELLASLYQHPKGFRCPAYREPRAGSGAADASEESADAEGETLLGVLPHQLRGSVYDYSTMQLKGLHYAKCTACSDAMAEAYRSGGHDFLLRCLNDPLYMEEVSGLKEEKEKAQKYDDMDWDADE